MNLGWPCMTSLFPLPHSGERCGAQGRAACARAIFGAQGDETNAANGTGNVETIPWCMYHCRGALNIDNFDPTHFQAL